MPIPGQAINHEVLSAESALSYRIEQKAQPVHWHRGIAPNRCNNKMCAPEWRNNMSLHLLLAPNALKGSLSASQTAAAMRRGALAADPDIHIISRPMSDGGDGFLEVMAGQFDARLIDAETTDPLGRAMTAQWGWVKHKQLGIIEMASASGMALLDPVQLNPMLASSEGTGKLLLAALDRGARRILLGLGGTATVDGGMGISKALGARFLDDSGHCLASCGGNLGKIRRVDLSRVAGRLKHTVIDLITDVHNPLLGKNGAARVFGPQKGASLKQVQQLEDGLKNLADVIIAATGRDMRDLPGAGAAGGTAGLMHALFGAHIRPGACYVAELTGLEDAVKTADLVITAEGRLDKQTSSGKAPAVVAEIARSHGVPCIAIVGDIGKDRVDQALFTRTIQLRDKGMAVETAMRCAADLMEKLTQQVIKEFQGT